jgi:hypothetical protein
MAAKSIEEMDETAACGLLCLEIELEGAGPAKLGRASQWWQRAVLSCARRRRAVQEYGQRYMRGVPGGFAWAFSVLCRCALYRK